MHNKPKDDSFDLKGEEYVYKDIKENNYIRSVVFHYNSFKYYYNYKE